jgi:hypothetical protein
MLSDHYCKFGCVEPEGEGDRFEEKIPHSATGGVASFPSVRTVSREVGKCGEGKMLLRQ